MKPKPMRLVRAICNVVILITVPLWCGPVIWASFFKGLLKGEKTEWSFLKGETMGIRLTRSTQTGGASKGKEQLNVTDSEVE